MTENSRNFLSALSSLFAKKDKNNQDTVSEQGNFRQQAAQLNTAIDQLKDKIARQREQAKKLQAAADGSNTPGKSGFKLGVVSAETLQQELETAQKDFLQSVIRLHGQLGTALDESRLSEIRERCQEILENVNGTASDDRIRKAIIEKIYSETGPFAWRILNELMLRKNLHWELPESRSANLSEQQIAIDLETRIGEIENLFMSQNLRQASEVLSGNISAWKRYPNQDSWLWKEVALRAVASGIRSALWLEAIEELKTNAAPLRSKAEELMQENLDQLDKMLSGGLNSIEQAEMLVANSNRIINEILPELAWDAVNELIEKRTDEILVQQQ